MAINPLSLSELLRPWRTAGITAILAEPRLEAPLPADSQDQGDHAPSGHIAETSVDVSEYETKTGEKAFSSATADGNGLAENIPRPASARPSSHPLSPNNVVSQQSAPSGESARGTGRQGHGGTKQVKSLEWPEAWQVLLARTNPAPIVWTYAELGEDLSGNGDKERSACLRRLISSLRLPKGSSAFWPVRLAPFVGEDAPASHEADNAPRSTGEAEFFQAGLQRLAPKVVIMLGAPAMELSGLDLPISIPFTQQIHKGVLYVLLPDFASLLGKAALQERAGVFLRAALSGLSLS